MKKSEVYIKKLAEKFKISEPTAAMIYKSTNTYDWTVFCSQMGDYDHPGERVAAKEKFENEMSVFSENFRKNVVDKIVEYMEHDSEYYIHDMDKEIT